MQERNAFSLLLLSLGSVPSQSCLQAGTSQLRLTGSTISGFSSFFPPYMHHSRIDGGGVRGCSAPAES